MAYDHKAIKALSLNLKLCRNRLTRRFVIRRLTMAAQKAFAENHEVTLLVLIGELIKSKSIQDTSAVLELLVELAIGASDTELKPLLEHCCPN